MRFCSYSDKCIIKYIVIRYVQLFDYLISRLFEYVIMHLYKYSLLQNAIDRQFYQWIIRWFYSYLPPLLLNLNLFGRFLYESVSNFRIDNQARLLFRLQGKKQHYQHRQNVF